jgi:hypothetical protein
LIAILFFVGLVISNFLPFNYIYDGKRWMYTPVGATITLSIMVVFTFLGVFTLAIIVHKITLFFNEWIYSVKKMIFGSNPQFTTWLYANDRKRWAEWTVICILPFSFFPSILLFRLISLGQITEETFAISTFGSIVIASLFSLIFYKAYTSRLETLHDSTLSTS